MDTRRDFLKKAALLTGAASLSTILPESIQRAFAIDAPEGSTFMNAEHVVILMQENRSFDHALGTLRGVRGYNDPRAIDLPNGNKVWLQSDSAGQTYLPFHLDIHNTKATWMDSLPHSWSNQVDARNDGKYDQWLNVKRNSIKAYSNMPLTMGFHNRQDIPFYYALADAFTVCDQNFCSSLTGTSPNRLHFWTGTIRSTQDEHSRACVWNDDMDYGTLNWTTFPERLEALGISWKCYQNELAIDTGFQGEEVDWLSNFQDNPLEFFAQYNVHLHPLYLDQLRKRLETFPAAIAALEDRIKALPPADAYTHQLEDQLKDMKAGLAEAGQRRSLLQGDPFAQLSEREKNLYRKAFDTNKEDPFYRELEELTYMDADMQRQMKAPKGDVLFQFRMDVHSGNLPAVSWITAPENFSDHPSAPWYGAWYVSEVLDALTQNPDVWRKTIFILAYDENDGYFDHVPPFTAPHPHKPGTGKVSEGIDTRVDYVTKEQEEERKGFPEPFDRECSIGLGFRVPLIIASPWTKGGWVNSEVFDHTSTLRFLETFLTRKTGKKLVETNISEWRRMICGDLTSVFHPYYKDSIPTLNFIPRDAFLEGIHKAQFRPLPNDFHAMGPDEITAFDKRPYMPIQEPGTRASCSLAYQLHVDGALNGDKFEIAFGNRNEVFGDRTLGAPFNVYAPGKYATPDEPGVFEPVRTWAYAVKPGDALTDAWPLKEFEGGRYHLRVYGPNGFFREFMGDSADPQAEILFDYERAAGSPSRLTGNVALELRNHSGGTLVVRVGDHAYGGEMQRIPVPAGAKLPLKLDLVGSSGWYDFSVWVDGYDFEKRYAGRVETGKDSISDPFMAKVQA